MHKIWKRIIGVAMAVLVIYGGILMGIRYHKLNSAYPSPTIVYVPKGETLFINNEVEFTVKGFRLLTEEQIAREYDSFAEEYAYLKLDKQVKYALVDIEITNYSNATGGSINSSILSKYSFVINSESWFNYPFDSVFYNETSDLPDYGESRQYTMAYLISYFPSLETRWESADRENYELRMFWYPYTFVLEL